MPIMSAAKFRAWDKLAREMLSWEHILAMNYSIKYLFSNDNLLPLFFTGLKDKNGKEMYGGDIIKTTSELMTGFGRYPTGKYQTEYYSIEYDAARAQYKERRLRDNFLLPLGLTQKIIIRYSEIIGNVYENPELLEASHVLLQ